MVLLCPFTKVEESFNVQACHDILHYGVGNVSAYDHNTFPGVVPRTFAGALAVSALAAPALLAAQLASPGGQLDKLWGLVAVRFALGLANVCALAVLRRQVHAKLGGTAAKYFAAATACQFHLLFYSSRPLPNTFALPLVTLALAAWLAGPARYARELVCLLTCAMFVLRSEVLVLAGAMVLSLLLDGSLANGFVL
jgi:alpha-1,6-mannosyltransferase